MVSTATATVTCADTDPAAGRPIIYWDVLTADQQSAAIMADIDGELRRQSSSPVMATKQEESERISTCCGQTDFDSEIDAAHADARRLADAVCEGEGLFSAVGGKGGVPWGSGSAEDEEDAASTVEDVVTSGEVRAKVNAAVYVAGLSAVATVAKAEAALQTTSQPIPEPEPEQDLAGQMTDEVRQADGVEDLLSLLPVPFAESFAAMTSNKQLKWALEKQEGIPADEEGVLVSEAAAQPVTSTPLLPDEIPTLAAGLNVKRVGRRPSTIHTALKPYLTNGRGGPLLEGFGAVALASGAFGGFGAPASSVATGFGGFGAKSIG